MASREVTLLLTAAARMVDAFARLDADEYFRFISPDADFVFYNVADRMPDRATYERLWQEWKAKELSFTCETSEVTARLITADIAIVTQRVCTYLDTHAIDERESLVFQRGSDDRWLVVHQHLSRAAEHGELPY